MGLGDTAKLLAELVFDDKGFHAGTQRAIRDTSNLEKSFHSASKGVGVLKTAMGTGLGFIGAQVSSRVIGGLFSTVKEAAIGMNSTLETSTLQFETLMGSASAAQKHVQGLFAFAARTPFETGPIIEASRIMRTFGGAALDTEKNLTLFGDAAAATSAPIEEVAMWMSRAYADIQAGRPFGEAAQRLMELGILTPQVRNQLEKMQKEGKKGPAIWAAMEKSVGKYSGAMAKQANTWSGLTSSLHDNLMLMSATALKPVFDTAKEGMAEMLDFLNTPEAQGAVEEFAASLEKVINPENLRKIPWKEIAGDAEKAGEEFVKFAKTIPWGTVADSMKIAGQTTKMALDAFMALPEPVKGAIVGAIAVNKLTGGGLVNLTNAGLTLATGNRGGGGGIVGAIAGGGVQKVFVVNMPAGGMGGGGGGAAVLPGKGGGLLGKLGTGLSVAGLGLTAFEAFQTWQDVTAQKNASEGSWDQNLAGWKATQTDLTTSIDSLNKTVDNFNKIESDPFSSTIANVFEGSRMSEALMTAAQKVAGSGYTKEGEAALIRAAQEAGSHGYTDTMKQILTLLDKYKTNPAPSSNISAQTGFNLSGPDSRLSASTGFWTSGPFATMSKETKGAINTAANQAHRDVMAQLNGQLDAKKAIQDANAIARVYTSGAAADSKWMGRNMEQLRALESIYLARGDVATANRIAGAINAMASKVAADVTTAVNAAANAATTVVTVINQISSRDIATSQTKVWQKGGLVAV